MTTQQNQAARPIPVSPLLLADRLLTLAQDADRAGMPAAATRLVRLAYMMCSQKPPLPA